MRAFRPPLLAAAGLLLGLAAAFLQELTLPWGALGADQRPWFHAAFGAAGGGAAGLLSLLSRRAALPLAAAGLAVLVALNPRPRPSVFLVVSDTTRADHLSLYGYERDTTPFLRELGARSVVFEDALSQGSHTIVSTPALLASCYPSEHGLNDYRDVLRDDHVLIPEVLQEAGYYTLGVVTNPHLSSQNGFAQGYDNYELYGRGTAEAVPAGDLRPIVERKLDFHRPLWEEAEPGRDGAPVFGFLFYTDPHSPYAPPDPWPARFLPAGRSPEDVPAVWNEEGPPDPTLRDGLLARYDASIAYWDDALRRLADSLRERDLWESALVVYTSDHGEEFLEHGGISHGSTLYEEAVRVPLLLSLPVPVRFPPLPRTARRVAGATAGIDVLPTLLEYLALPVPPGARGTSRLAVALGRAAVDPREVVILEEILEHYEFHDLAAVRDSRHKFVRIRRGVGERPDETEFLFDLHADPREQVNRIEEDAQLADRFRGTLEEHQRRVRARPAASVRRWNPDPAHLERLRALGYIHD